MIIKVEMLKLLFYDKDKLLCTVWKKKKGSVVQHVTIFCVVKERHLYLYNFPQKMTRICFTCLIFFPFVKHIHTHDVLIIIFFYLWMLILYNIYTQTHTHIYIHKYTYTTLLKDVCKYSRYIFEKKKFVSKNFQ